MPCLVSNELAESLVSKLHRAVYADERAMAVFNVRPSPRKHSRSLARARPTFFLPKIGIEALVCDLLYLSRAGPRIDF